MAEGYEKAQRCITSGLIGLVGALAIWRMTGNFWGWLALAAPGGFLIFYGSYLALRES